MNKDEEGDDDGLGETSKDEEGDADGRDETSEDEEGDDDEGLDMTPVSAYAIVTHVSSDSLATRYAPHVISPDSLSTHSAPPKGAITGSIAPPPTGGALPVPVNRARRPTLPPPQTNTPDLAYRHIAARAERITKRCI